MTDGLSSLHPVRRGVWFVVVALACVPLTECSKVKKMLGMGAAASASASGSSDAAENEHEAVEHDEEEDHATGGSAHGTSGGHGAAPGHGTAPGNDGGGGAGASSVHAPAHAMPTPDQVSSALAAGNARFVAGTPLLREYPKRREELFHGQHPEAIVLGCSDSRVSPEVLFDKNLGELFVIRTAGNIADPIELGSIEYAVEHLHVPVVLVLGHEKCGAVAAAAAGGPMPSPNLQSIVDKITPALEGLRAKYKGDALAKAGIAPNVHQSARDLVKNSTIVREHVDSGKLKILKAVYHLQTGKVEMLP